MDRPVTLEALFGGGALDPIPDPYPVYARLRREQPVLRIAPLVGGAEPFLITRYDDVRDTLRNNAVFSNRANARGISQVFGRTIVEMDGREHTRQRNIITPALAPRALTGDFAEQVDRIAHELIDGFAGDGHADLVERFTFTFPLRVFSLILGLPVGDYEELHRWSIDLSHVGDDPPRAFAASRALGDYLRPHVAGRRSQGGEAPAQRAAGERSPRAGEDDLISRLVAAEVDAEKLDGEEVISFLRLLVSAGAETTYHLIGSALVGLLTHPESLAELRADPGLLRPAIDEALRWETPIQLMNREALEDAEVAGVAIPTGSPVLLSLGSANRDERVFEAPDRFDLRRSPNEHLSFGLGKHYCAGSRLAYLEASRGLAALLERLPNLRLDPRAPGRRVAVGLAVRGPDRLPVLFDAA